MTSVPYTALAPRTLNWISAQRPGSCLETAVRLLGSTSSTLHRLEMRVDGQREVWVVRQFDNRAWLEEEPDIAVQEAAALQHAARSALSAPQLVAIDPHGVACGLPTVLMTCLEGQVVLRPERTAAWLDEMARTLARIHTVNADDLGWEYFAYQDLDALGPPEWSEHTSEWQEVIRIVCGPRPASLPVFIHRDYHPANLLWQGGQLSGVVDWVNACRGPAGIDVGHCRVNLAQLHGVQTADAFLEAYLRAAGSAFRYHPYWDLLSLIDIVFGPPRVYAGWMAFGVNDLTDAQIAQRLEVYMLSLLDRVRG